MEEQNTVSCDGRERRRRGKKKKKQQQQKKQNEFLDHGVRHAQLSESTDVPESTTADATGRQRHVRKHTHTHTHTRQRERERERESYDGANIYTTTNSYDDE